MIARREFVISTVEVRSSRYPASLVLHNIQQLVDQMIGSWRNSASPDGKFKIIVEFNLMRVQ